jgi:hypothetical protein
LTLVISRAEFIAIESCKKSSDVAKVDQYDGLLNVLREAEGGNRRAFQRTMKVESLMRAWRVKGGLDHDTVRDLHMAWGGRMEVNGELEWLDYAHVGNCAGIP